MTFLDKLTNSSNSVADLNFFIEKNSIELYDFFISQKYSCIKIHREQIEPYILIKYGIYRNLDFTQNKNSTFILCLLDVSERFGLHTEFQLLYNLAISKGIKLSSRSIAASKFLIGIREISDYNNRINEILDDLSISFLKEEDDEQKVIATLIYYYLEVFYNFGHSNLIGVKEFRSLLIGELSKDHRKYLYTSHIKEILFMGLDNIDFLFSSIHEKLDEILNRSDIFFQGINGTFLIESNTAYSQLLYSINNNFLEIRRLCNNLYTPIANNETFWSLQRGVKILTESNQLLAYIHSYGNMHYEKIMSALESLDGKLFKQKMEVYDWGSGQGIASLCFIEYLCQNSIDHQIAKINLIEPSLIALKRAALHIKKFDDNSNIATINKDLDSLTGSDLKNNSDTLKFHLFSNILDIDKFSMNYLIKNIKSNIKGLNYFICVSPFISDYKTQRLDDFTLAFRACENFEILLNKTERKGEWVGTNWSRVIRVFKANL